MSKGVPEMRFKRFTKSWDSFKLGDISEIRTGPFGSTLHAEDYVENGIPIITTQHFKNGYLPINKEDIPQVSDEDYTRLKSYILDEGDIVFSRVGSVDLNALVKKENEGWLFSGRVLRVRLNKVFDAEFIHHVLDTTKVKNNIITRAVGQTMPSINTAILKETPITVTLLKEQQKIGTFFKQLDDTIALQQQLVRQQQQYKKAMLKKMFPQKGERVPKVRFDGFSEDWEEKKLKDMTKYKNGKGNESNQSTDGKYELINLNSISINGGLKPSGKFVNEADETLQQNDLVMILSDVGHGDLLGRVALIPENNKFVLNQRVALLRPNELVNVVFLFYCINANQYYFKSQGAGMSQLNISRGSVEMFPPYVPSLEEQQKIGDFFKQLDDTISLHKKKLEDYQQLKKALLQRMFV